MVVRGAIGLPTAHGKGARQYVPTGVGCVRSLSQSRGHLCHTRDMRLQGGRTRQKTQLRVTSVDMWQRPEHSMTMSV
eukprot:1311066-Prymnesium_polylepis.1